MNLRDSIRLRHHPIEPFYRLLPLALNSHTHKIFQLLQEHTERKDDWRSTSRAGHSVLVTGSSY
ncbi:hypothetical protein CY34DRAFT_813496 [Suillus luteus UH-Slu-Lm8-n1]|uniref:Uncharacterized protein n=1 Tax=Suillus luteus UH-Slu-Lm8-n1 TaxID=930992 RepID=A0A0C9ZW28_9AGAM|nr:hypothetical protein CY34DRAFT_813496 [Suillus luteus UH-Slu-Lm8-n1]